jgi:thioredoxin reductase
MLGEIARDIHRANRTMLLDMVKNRNIDVYVHTKVIEIKNDKIHCIGSDLQEILLDADSVVLATGLTPMRDLYLALLEDPSFETYAIGDCKKPRKIGDAIWEACMLALNI